MFEVQTTDDVAAISGQTPPCQAPQPTLKSFGESGQTPTPPCLAPQLEHPRKATPQL